MAEAAAPLGLSGPVLVVDDDPSLLEFICMALAAEGYETARACDGLQALALSEARRPALVLMDVGMPQLGGRELADRINQLGGGAIPCVIMSGSRPEPDVLEAATVTGYLAKPFDIEDLFGIVRRYAGSSAVTAAG